MVKRLHMSSNSSLTKRRFYMQKEQSLKPNGLWYSLDKEWINWCSSEMPHWKEKYNHLLEVDLSRILIISSIRDVKNLESLYGSKEVVEKWGITYNHIDWVKLSEDYDGIEIRNYYDIKFSIPDGSISQGMWFYSWDIPSGCIWNLRSLLGSKSMLTENV